MGGIAEIRGGHCGDLGWSLRGFGVVIAGIRDRHGGTIPTGVWIFCCLWCFLCFLIC